MSNSPPMLSLIGYSNQVSLGDLLTLITVVASGVAAIVGVVRRRKAHQQRIDRILQKFVSLSDSDVELLRFLDEAGGAREDRIRKALGVQQGHPVITQELIDSGLLVRDSQIGTWSMNSLFVADVGDALKQLKKTRH